MTALNHTLLKKFLKLAGDSLTGEWLLVGGTLLPAVGLNVRATMDIDLVGLGKKEASQTLELMTLAEQLELGVETINQAAAFFVRKYGYEKSDLLLLHQGKSAKIFRPSVNLYWKLKVHRLSDSDTTDCQHYYHFCKGQNDRVQAKDLRKIIKVRKKNPLSPEQANNLTMLENLLE